MRDLRVFSSVAALDRAAAEAAAAVITSAVRAHGRCSIALSGGTTPRHVYELLGSRFVTRVPWAAVHVFWGDERLVPPGDPRRNDRMAREMLLDRVPCPDSQIHPMAVRASQPPEDAAREYEEMMRQHFAGGRPRFDLVFLGLGAEGHTASLFPHSPALDERVRWVRAVEAPASPRERLTLTFPALSEAANVFFLVTGAEKAGALRAALDRTADVAACPAAGVRPVDGRVTWWVDGPAAGANDSAKNTSRDHDIHKGAVEQTEHDPIVPIEPLGANFEDGEVSNADEKGNTNDEPRDEPR